jgi:predicted nucleotidyltransferase
VSQPAGPRGSAIAAPAWELLGAAADASPWPLMFATVSGAHLYGFASPDSDFDLRGVHTLPAADVVGLDTGPETLDRTTHDGAFELDLVTHDAAKFFRLLLKNNGYVLEQLLSPLIVRTTPAHEELVALAPRCITRHHAHHYEGFARRQRALFERERPRRVKPLLYTYRVLLTGIHLMRSGEIEANLVRLNDGARLSGIDDLVARKVGGREQETLPDGDADFHLRQVESLEAQLGSAAAASTLPDAPDARPALHDLLVRLRLGGQPMR